MRLADVTVKPGAARMDAPSPPTGHAGASASHTLPLSVDRLCYRADGRELLSAVSFAVQADTFNVILGPNGAGKSLLLRLCHGLLRPSSGRISWRGLSPAQARARHAMVFQHPVVLRRSVAANVYYPLAVRHVPRSERRDRVREALEVTNLAHLAHAPATRLSGGEQQRLALARAWALRPEVVLLDEPSANLDPRATLDLETLVNTMRTRGTAVIMTTHDLAQARRLSERVLFLNRGQLLEDAAARDFFIRPASPEAQAFLAGELLA